jgi:unsaturated rhamnogalacturonyl hydrolase
MTTYFDEMESLRYRFGDDDKQMLQVLADRYIGANPPAPFVYRVFHRTGVLQTEEGLYSLDLQEKLPHARNGQYAYAYGLVWSDNERNLDVQIRCLGPVRLMFNGERMYRSTVIDELKPDAFVTVNLTFRQGWNRLGLTMVKTAAGFGCLIGAAEAKVRILNVLSPFHERKGQAGWIVSEPTDEERYGADSWPDPFRPEAESGLIWLPRREWEKEDLNKLNGERLYGLLPGKSFYAKTAWPPGGRGERSVYALEGYTAGPLKVWVDEDIVLEQQEAGSFHCQVCLRNPGILHHVLVRSECSGQGWGFRLHAAADGKPSRFQAPVQAHGTADPWFYTGPFESEAEPELADLRRMDRLYPLKQGAGGIEDRTYWQVDAPGAWLRPYYENAMLSNKWTVGNVTNFGRWDYPLGVTMYGLLQTGRLLGRADMVEYALRHIEACTEMYEYSLWDRHMYGFPAVNHQLVLLKMLDNCGSFGSAMLEAYKERHNPVFARIADRIAEFMCRELERKEDGVFYRECAGDYSENTIWADDLYMSTPFLRRYAEMTGRSEYLDEAARQFRLFKRYLFMPEQRVMSHVYDFKYGVPTGVPWGRGNGWTIFSLSELLEALPEEHEEHSELLSFFNELCEGYAALQGENGLWHQVLNDPDSYQEASCTAMFAYAFARGVRFGWLADKEKYAAAAFLAWDGLTRYALDRHGNVHGVCSGSRYSFSPDYYKYDLLTVTNDNHGIGIMLLAGTEVWKAKRSLAADNPA